MFNFTVLLVYLFPIISWGLSHSQIAIEPEWDSIAWISSEARIENDSTTAYCNATWISKDLLVTAAHCISHAYLLNNHNIVIELGSYKNHGFKGFAFNQRIEAKVEFIFLPSLLHRLKQNRYKTQIHPSEDIALIKLNEEINLKGQKLTKLLPEDYYSSIQKNPLKYWPTVVTVNLFETLSHSNSRQLALLNQISWNQYFKSTSTSRIAEGDSGAPLFFRVGNEWYIGAIVKGRGKNYFNNWDSYASLKSVHSLLRRIKN